MAEQITDVGEQVVLQEAEADTKSYRVNRWPVARRFARHRLALASLVVVLLLALVAIFAPLLVPHDPYAQSYSPTLPPGPGHPLGTDDLGRDELSRVILGARVSLGVSVGAAFFAILLGLLVGALSG